MGVLVDFGCLVDFEIGWVSYSLDLRLGGSSVNKVGGFGVQ